MSEDFEVKSERENIKEKLILSIIISVATVLISLEVFTDLVSGSRNAHVAASIITGVIIFRLLQFIPEEDFKFSFSKKRGRFDSGVDGFVELIFLVVVLVISFLSWVVIQFILNLFS